MDRFASNFDLKTRETHGNVLGFTGKINFDFLSRPTQLRISNQAKNIPVSLPSSPIKI